MAFSRRKWWYQCAKFGANGRIYSEKEGSQRGSSPTARVRSAAVARRKWWDFQREEGPPRGDPQRERTVHSEEAAPQHECVQRRWLWRSATVALAFTGGRCGVGDF
ncbi:Uncharacterized protein Fot_36577 [Forsythia ovata]|uniref:Uncharacterized protein n=1 Tax=Forsythia ovata TaxID=205694 RepID=A0ABD1SPW0_9LAMI